MINNLEQGSTHRVVCAPVDATWCDIFFDFIDAGAVHVFETKSLGSSTDRFWFVDPWLRGCELYWAIGQAVEYFSSQASTQCGGYIEEWLKYFSHVSGRRITVNLTVIGTLLIHCRSIFEVLK